LGCTLKNMKNNIQSEGVAAGLATVAINAVLLGPATIPFGLIGMAAGLALDPDFAQNAKRFCEGRDANPKELALVRYHPDADTI
jgi:hypothetical protein